MKWRSHIAKEERWNLEMTWQAVHKAAFVQVPRPHSPALCSFSKQDPEGLGQVSHANINTLTSSTTSGMFLKLLLRGERTLRLLKNKWAHKVIFIYPTMPYTKMGNDWHNNSLKRTSPSVSSIINNSYNKACALFTPCTWPHTSEESIHCIAGLSPQHCTRRKPSHTELIIYMVSEPHQPLISSQGVYTTHWLRVTEICTVIYPFYTQRK